MSINNDRFNEQSIISSCRDKDLQAKIETKIQSALRNHLISNQGVALNHVKEQQLYHFILISDLEKSILPRNMNIKKKLMQK